MKQAYDYLVSFGVISLVVAGLGGLSFHAFREGGWISTALSHAWAIEVQYPVVAIPLTVGGILAFTIWHNHRRALGLASRVHNLLVYGLMAAGAYFISQYTLQGAM
ncbi:MAG TPA: hypothetical protein VIQ62_05795 [Burkholderiales bacterium]